jgi:hypothetical protein
MAERGQVDIDHHRIDHRPDQDGDHQVHRCDLETRQRHEDTRHSHAQAHPSHDAHRHPTDSHFSKKPMPPATAAPAGAFCSETAIRISRFPIAFTVDAFLPAMGLSCPNNRGIRRAPWCAVMRQATLLYIPPIC